MGKPWSIHICRDNGGGPDRVGPNSTYSFGDASRNTAVYECADYSGNWDRGDDAAV